MQEMRNKLRHGRALTGCMEGLKLEAMQWTEPKFEEISLGCEINSYACAEL